MSVEMPVVASDDAAPEDLFARAAGGPAAPRRPRLLSHVGRWGRARRWLPPDARRVLDVGCSSGYAMAAITTTGPTDRLVVGVERDSVHLRTATERYPWLTIVEGDARTLPVEDGAVDAVLLLDVIEHISDPGQVLAEAARVLAPGGAIIVTVPHRGPTRWLDALNLYAGVRRRRPSLPPLESATESDGGPHQHFTAAAMTNLLSPWFTVDRVARTGLGLQELVTITLVLIRVGFRAPAIAKLLTPLWLVAYIADDLLPTGPLAYHLAVRARVAEATAPA